MHSFLVHLFWVFARMGGTGLLLLGILDSSFLMMPLGNDLLMVALTVRKPDHLLYYVAMATAGSTLGCLIIDWLARRGGEQGLSKILPENRIEYVKKKVGSHAGRVLALAAIMPPPFPFTPFVAGAAALQYPRVRLLSILAVMRAVRFGAIGWLAMSFGKRILAFQDSPVLIGVVLLVVAGAVIGSVVSVVGWIRRARRGAGGGKKPNPARPSAQRSFPAGDSG